MTTNLNKYVSKEIQGTVAVTTASISKTAATISAVVWSSGTATVTAASHGFLAGDTVVIAGLASAAGNLNSTFTISEVTNLNTFKFLYATDPTTISDQSGTATITGFLPGMPISGATSLSTAVVKKAVVSGANTIITYDSIGGNIGAESGLFADSETINGRTISAAVVATAGDLPVGSLAIGTDTTPPASTSTIMAADGGLIKSVVTGSRVRQEVLVASRNFKAKQAA